MSGKEKIEKLPKPIDKFIWLGVSLAVAVAGFFLKSNIEIPWWIGAVISIALLTVAVIAAQKVSAERAALAENSEKKVKYAFKTILYYFYIFIAVIYDFLSLWMVGILSI